MSQDKAVFNGFTCRSVDLKLVEFVCNTCHQVFDNDTVMSELWIHLVMQHHHPKGGALFHGVVEKSAAVEFVRANRIMPYGG